MVASADARRLIARWHDDPVAFAVDVLGVNPWDRQAELLRAVAGHDAVAVRSGQKTGKSTSAAILALWFALTRERARVVLTSSSATQVREVLWAELSRLYREAKVPIGGELGLIPATGLRFPDGRSVIGISTDKPENWGGYSGPNQLFLADEASGIADSLIEALEGNRAGGCAKLVLISNPTRTSGFFYEVFRTQNAFWRRLHISSEETPNATGIGTSIPGLATAEYIHRRRQEWGVDSLPYAVRVRGDFPSQDESSLIALALVNEAQARYAETPADGPLVLGVDPARFGGDSSVIAPVRGKKALPFETVRKADGPTVAGTVMEVVRVLRTLGERPRVNVDVIGVGASVFDSLRLYDNEIDLNPVDAGSASRIEIEGRPAYGALRDQLWVDLRDWIKSGGALPDDSALEGELVGTTYSYDPRGRLKVESKDSMKQRLRRSPDRADALALAVFTGTTHHAPATYAGLPSVRGLLPRRI